LLRPSLRKGEGKQFRYQELRLAAAFQPDFTDESTGFTGTRVRQTRLTNAQTFLSAFMVFPSRMLRP